VRHAQPILIGPCFYQAHAVLGYDGGGVLIFRQVQDNYRFGGERHIDPASDYKDLNPATLAPRLLWSSTMSQSG
jgi:hypothetical protein